MNPTVEKAKKIAILAVILGLISVAYVWGKCESKTEITREYELKISEQEKQLNIEYTESLERLVSNYEARLYELEKKTVETDKETIFNKDGSVVVKEKTKSKSTKKKDTKVVGNTKSEKETKEGKSEIKEKSKESEEKTKEKIVKEITSPPSWRVYATALLTHPSEPKRSSYGAGFMYDVGPFNVGAYGLHDADKKEAALGFTAGIAF